MCLLLYFIITMSYILGETPIIISRNNSYVEVEHIKYLFKRYHDYSVWTPNGWEKILDVEEKIITHDDLNNLDILVIHNNRNILRCLSTTKILSEQYKNKDQCLEELNNVISNRHICAMIYQYALPIMDMSILGQHQENFYMCPYPQSQCVDAKKSQKKHSYRSREYIYCYLCDTVSSTNCYTCVECSKERYRYEDDYKAVNIITYICERCYLYYHEDKSALPPFTNHKINHTLIPQKCDYISLSEYYNSTDVTHCKKALIEYARGMGF
jgi:hypothetical protein